MSAALRLCLPVAVLSLTAAFAAREARAARLAQDSPGTTTLTVTVALAGARAGGDVGCALFAGPQGFQEAWGVSNNVRPSMRAPRFEEAAVRIAGGPVEIGIEVRK